ncbi:MAG TPA: diacylglycerol kinase family protein [Flavipsychrobacter sp.]
MKSSKGIYFGTRLRSIGFAIEGLKQMILTEPNARIHLAITTLVVIAGIITELSMARWLAIVFAISIVWITEAVNTALEKLCDHTCGNEFNAAIKKVKDIAAGAVLIAALCSVITGIIVFTS